MKKVLAILIAVVMTVSVIAITANAEGETLKIFIGNEETTASINPSGVSVEQSGDGIIATTENASDPWISVELDGVDMSVYKFFTVTYRCDTEIGRNNTYMKVAGYIGAADGGDWEPHGMENTADGEWHTKEYSMEGFTTFTDQEITGIRLTCCGAVGGKFEVASIRFTTEHYEEPSEPAPISEKAADQWLCGEDPGTAIQPGWWFNPVGEHDDRYVEVSFTAETKFSGVHGFYYCSNVDNGFTLAHMKVELVKDGTVVAEAELASNGDAWADTDFGKTFEPGDYSLRYTCKEGSGVANDCWCVIGYCAGSGSATVDCNVNAPAAGSYPALMLIGAAEEGAPAPTSDAAIIAIAAVGCIALAGVVVAKKVR